MNHQLRWGREARRVAEPGAMLTLLDMAEVLIDAGYKGEEVVDALPWPEQGNISKWDRFQEAIDVASTLWDDTLERAKLYPPQWHALREPARWVRQQKVSNMDLLDFVVGFTERLGRWPSVDELRNQFGFVSGHKAAGDHPEQAKLDV